jgi:REP element-mobilizing transposase RayT
MSQKTAHLLSIGEYFHIYNRGVDRKLIFFEEENYEFFLRRIDKYLDPSKLTLLVFCLMPNHFHFVFRQDQPNALSEFMGNICKSYAKAINNRLDRSGHLFESKYKLKHIDEEMYLLNLSRYIHLNPVAAGLVTSPVQWQFSSYGSYCGLHGQAFVSTKEILSLMKGSEYYEEYVNGYKKEDRKVIAKYLF